MFRVVNGSAGERPAGGIPAHAVDPPAAHWSDASSRKKLSVPVDVSTYNVALDSVPVHATVAVHDSGLRGGETREKFEGKNAGSTFMMVPCVVAAHPVWSVLRQLGEWCLGPDGVSGVRSPAYKNRPRCSDYIRIGRQQALPAAPQRVRSSPRPGGCCHVYEGRFAKSR